MSKTKLKMVEVTWEDACFTSREQSVEEAEASKLLELHMVGYLVGRYKDRVVIAEEWDPKNKLFRFVHVLPISNVSKVRYLR